MIDVKESNINNLISAESLLKTIFDIIKNIHKYDSLSKLLPKIACQISAFFDNHIVSIVNLQVKNKSQIFTSNNSWVEVSPTDIQVPITVQKSCWGYIAIELKNVDRDYRQQCQYFLEFTSSYLEIAIELYQLRKQKESRLIKEKEPLVKAQEEIQTLTSEKNICNLESKNLFDKFTELEQIKINLEQENIKSKLLHNLIQKIHKYLDLKDILKTTVEETRDALNIDRLMIYRVNSAGDGEIIEESKLPEYSSLLGIEFYSEHFPLDCQDTFKETSYKAISNSHKYYKDSHNCMLDFIKLWEIKSKIIIPIKQNKNLWGFLIAHQCSEFRNWSQSELELLTQLVTNLEIAIKQSFLYQKLQQELAHKISNEATIKASLAEKEVLLKEIHHRVKNNLNVISSLLNLQTHYINNPEIVNQLMDSRNRITSMALIHEQLYQSDSFSKLNLADYISRLVDNLRNLYSSNVNNIKFELNLSEVPLTLETAVPCGLLINEMVTNSLKHAFLDRSEGLISIDLSCNDEQYELEIKDDGRGIPPEVDWKNSKSLGLRLIQLLSMQLDAETKRIPINNGTAFKISFTELEYTTSPY